MTSFLARCLRLAVKLYLGIAVLFTTFSLFAAYTPFAPWYGRILAGNWTDSDGDVLIVLGADTNPDGLIGQYSYWRCVYAVRAWRTGHFSRMVLSGGPVEGTSLTIASSMRDYIVGNGVPKEAIFLEDRSHSTRENALFTKQLIAGWPGKKVLLTSDLHMYRAARVFRAAGLDVVPRPVPDSLKGSYSGMARWQHSFGLVMETIKIVYYTAHGWM